MIMSVFKSFEGRIFCFDWEKIKEIEIYNIVSQWSKPKNDDLDVNCP